MTDQEQDQHQQDGDQRRHERARDDRTGQSAAEARIQHQGQWVEQQLRIAFERGDFDDLPGAGKPLEGLGTDHDPDWWVKRLVEREQISVLPPALELRKEDAELAQRLDRITAESEVREELESFNARVRRARMQLLGRPAGDHPRARRRGRGRGLARASYGAHRGPAGRASPPSSRSRAGAGGSAAGAEPSGSGIRHTRWSTGLSVGSAPCAQPRTSSARSPSGPRRPVTEIPARPSRAIHFFDPSNAKMAAKVPEMVGTVDVLLGNLEDAVKADNKEAARAGLVGSRRRPPISVGRRTQLWTRINSLDSPWVLDDLTTLVTEIGDKLDVIMVPKVEGAEDIHYVDRLLAQLEAKAGLDRPLLVHAILETARGVANVEEICGASPRMQGLSLGPADLAANRRMKTTRVGGGHPGYLVRQDADPDQPEAHRDIYQQDLWHYTIARMVDACAMHGILPYYGPFGDIKDVVACEDQFRNAFLLGCVGAWSLHPKQIDIANRVFAPSADESRTPAGSSRPWATAPAPSCSTARWRTTPRSSSAR